MSSNIIQFPFGSNCIRVAVSGVDTPMFNASDVCSALGFANPRQAVASHVDPDDVQSVDAIDRLGRMQQSTYVNESGVYALVFGSRKPEARTFKRWVTSEVLPTIRQTACYGGFNVPATYAGALRLAAEQTEKLEAAEKKIQEQQPKVEFVDRYVDDNEFRISIRELAKLLCMGERDCVSFLIGSNVLYRNQRKVLLPHFRQVELRHAAVKTYVDGRICGHQTFFSRKGHLYVAGLLEDSYRKFALESPR